MSRRQTRGPWSKGTLGLTQKSESKQIIPALRLSLGLCCSSVPLARSLLARLPLSQPRPPGAILAPLTSQPLGSKFGWPLPGLRRNAQRSCPRRSLAKGSALSRSVNERTGVFFGPLFFLSTFAIIRGGAFPSFFIEQCY